MRKKKLRLLLIVLCGGIFPFFLSAQQVGTVVKGLVQNEEKRPVQAATVFLLKLPDSSLTKTAITNSIGEFSFTNIKAGKYFIKITFASFEQQFSNPFETKIEKQLYQVGAITLRVQAKQLEVVSVTAKKPFIELLADRMVLNIEGSSINAGTNVMEVLEKAPMLQVDQLSGKININGKDGTLVMINGRPTYLSAADLAELLKTMPSDQLVQIEIITNPPAKYEAAGNAGIVNLKLKKNQKEGLNGSYSVSIAQGKYFKASTITALNFRKGKWNIYANYSLQKRKDYTEIIFERNFFNAVPKVISIQNSYRIFNVAPQNYNAGIDFYKDKKTTLGLLIKGYQTDFNSPQTNSNDFFNTAQEPQSFSETTAMTSALSSNFSANLNFRKAFDSTGRELLFDADISKFVKENKQNFTTVFFDGNHTPRPDSVILSGNNFSDVIIKAFRADYIHPVKKGVRIETGFKISSVLTDNFPQFSTTKAGISTIDTGLTNHFVYKENIYAAYTSIQKEFKKITVQAGLRGEYTQGMGDQKITNTIFKRDYFEVFPTFYIQYHMAENQNISFAYGRRIDRPEYQDLNPYRLYLDPFTFWQGNSFLGPQFTNNYEIAYQHKNLVILKLNHTRSSDVISDIIRQIDTSKLSIKYKENLNQFTNTGLLVTTSYRPATWWTGNFSGNLYLNKYSGIYLAETFIKKLLSFSFSVSNSFRISQQVSADINAWYQAERLSGIEESYSKYSVSLGIRRVSKDKKTTIQLNVSDIFLGQRGGGKTLIGNIDNNYEVRYDSRVARLSFSYRFGKKTVSAARRKETGIEDEKNRVSN